MKILFLSDDFPPSSFGGAGISTYELALGVKRVGHEVYVVTTCRKPGGEGESALDGLTVFKIQSDYEEKWRAYRSLYNRKVVKKLEKILREVKPDVVHANNIHYHLSYHSLKLSKKHAKTVILTFRDTMAFTYGKLETKKYLNSLDPQISWVDNLRQAQKRWNPFRNIIIKKYLRYPDKLVCVSEALREALEVNGIPNVKAIHTGLDLSQYGESSGSNRKIVFFAGRLSKAKGSQVIEEAMRGVSHIIPEAKLITAGTGAKWLNREEMKEAYLDSSVVLAPSLYLDPFPRTVIEGMALGKAVITSHYGGASEAVVDGETGHIVNPFNIGELRDRIVDLLQNPDKAYRLGKAGRARIEKKFNLEDKVKEYMDLYKV